MKQSTNMAKVLGHVHLFREGLSKWEEMTPSERKLSLSIRLLEIKMAWWRDRVRRFGL